MILCKRAFVVLMFFIPYVLFAQTEEPTTGIHFEDLSGWQAVKEKAKQENKYIFVDCFATWCGPCKKMDKEVYTIDSIGKFYDANFLVIKVQIDSTNKDNDQVKTWYNDAKFLQTEYKITSLPTFLFFSPNGKLVHKGIGFMPAAAFNSLGRNALDPQNQYYTLLESFKQGKLTYLKMADLANMARANNDFQLADTLSGLYVNNYLLKLNENELYARNSLRAIAGSVRTSHDKGFQLFYKHAARIDSVMKNNNFSMGIVGGIIEHEEIDNRIYLNGRPFKSITPTPDWNAVNQQIKKKYNAEYAARVVLWAKIKWLEYKKDWPEYCKNVILKVEKYGPYLKYYPNLPFATNYLLNASAWDIFTYSTDTLDLKKALEWSAISITDPKPEADYFDTYANILHKLGKDKEALPYEEKAAALNPSSKEIADNLAKLKKGEPTWETQ